MKSTAHSAGPTDAEKPPSRFVIGIDLGTTNCAVAYCDTRGGGRRVSDFPVRQFTAPGISEAIDTLPSFLYALTDEERTEADALVDAAYRAGVHARDHGALTPGRLVASAKSWLCHAGVDREAAILPWHAAPGVKAISPVVAQSVLLKHIRAAWDDAHPAAPLTEQDVYITVPASFDEVARELTIAAARQAGIPAPVLLEEPQAAFYAWLARHEDTWLQQIAADDHILVCDIGGGTTDLTLIHARPGPDGHVVFHRTAVGDHLILGGDNLDLALARRIEEKLGEGKLDAATWATLVRRCRFYKETLLGPDAPEQIEVTLPGRGAGLLRGQRQTTLERAEVETLLLDGFMPRTPFDASPVRRASGFQEFGLPFAPDPGITRYLAEFLRTNLPRHQDGTPVAPQAILLNGGLFESPAMRQRFREALTTWFSNGPDWQPHLLDHRRLDLAVARGAAYFGLVRRGQGVRVVSNLARAYYIGVGSAAAGEAPRALCMAPAGLPPGHPVRIDEHPLRVRLKTPVEFPLYVSSRRTTDPAGALIPLDEESFTALPPVRTVLATGKQATRDQIDVAVEATLTELGSLDFRVVETGGERAWKLAFDLRAATQTDLQYHDGAGEQSGLIEASQIEEASACLRRYFELPAARISGHSVLKEIESILERPRTAWPASALRALWESLLALADTRRLSAQHEQRWLNLTGYCLRPGFGLALDDWRVAETWKLFHTGPINRGNEAVRSEWWIVWRRLAGGLSTGQQSALATPALAALRALASKNRARLPGGWEIKWGDHETIELLRMLSVLERLPAETRSDLGNRLIRRIREKGTGTDRGAAVWALGRIGARVPLYGPANQLVAAETVAGWLNDLITTGKSGRDGAYAIMSMARFTGDRYRDLDDTTRATIVAHLNAINAPTHWITLVAEGGALNADEQAQAFGDQLPCGLMLANQPAG